MRETPYERIQRSLRPRLGPLADHLPSRWERLGDVLVIRLPEALREQAHSRSIARTYAEVLGVGHVLEDQAGVSGALREPTMRRLHGEGQLEVTHVENGVRYVFDPSKVMFSSGNLDERVRMAKVEARGETIVDLFAGIGYYTLPLLVHADVGHVHACELNPNSVAALQAGAATNGVDTRLTIHEGDCRAVAPTDLADRVLMGYFPRCHRFLPTALAALSPKGGWIHYHDTVKAGRGEEEMLHHVEAALADAMGAATGAGAPLAAAGRREPDDVAVETDERPAGAALHRSHHLAYRIRTHEHRHVKSYAPGVHHDVLDLYLEPVP